MKSTLILIAMILSSCGSNSSNSGSGSTRTNAGGDATATSACNGFDKANSGITFTSNRNIAVSSDGVLANYPAGSEKSLCNLLSDEKVDVISMQFSGVYCLTCQDQAAAMAAFIASENLSARVRHFVVFVDPAESEITEAEFNGFITAHSATSKKMFDPEKNLMKKASSNASDLKFGTSIAFNAYGDIYGQDTAEGDALTTFKDQIKKLLPKK